MKTRNNPYIPYSDEEIHEMVKELNKKCNECGIVWFLCECHNNKIKKRRKKEFEEL